jgi:N-acetylmuramidase
VPEDARPQLQYARLEEAIACDRLAALESASWGLGQIMGFNAGLAGVRDAEELVLQMVQGENEQLLAMARFMRASGMHLPLQRRDWTGFASRYNGPSFAKNSYHEKLAAAHATLAARGLPDLNARAVQLLLTYHGFDPGKIDGVMGARTRAAIGAFASKHAVTAPTDHKELRSVLPRAAVGAFLRSRGVLPTTVPDARLLDDLLKETA